MIESVENTDIDKTLPPKVDIDIDKRLPPKVRKKISRARVKLIKDGFQFSDSPTPYLVISNAGIANGMRRKDLELLIEDFEALVMPPLKSYAMVVCKGTGAADKIVNKFQGHIMKSDENLASIAPTLYFHYVHSFNGCANLEGFTSMNYQDVPGLILHENFISEEQENELVCFLENEIPVNENANEPDLKLKHRQVWHYGYKFRYKYNDVDLKRPLEDGIPQILRLIISRMINTGYVQKHPDQITVNKYEPGQGIPPHIDDTEAFDEILVSLSLSSQTIMDFKNAESNSHVQVLLRPRSLVVLTGDARTKWTHGICPRKVDLLPTDDGDDNLSPVNRGMRYSITFRKVRDDYRGPGKRQTVVDPVASQPKSEAEAASLEELHVHKVYDEIASHFTETRDKPWPRVKQFIDSLEPHSIVLDVGCGSGRYLGVRDDVHMVGCDRSENLIGICKEKGFEVFTCDGLDLPIRQKIFDACICIAVIHHYSTLGRRLKAVEEILKMTKSGGKILISVWALEQEYKRVKSKYLKKVGQSELSVEDCPEATCSGSQSGDLKEGTLSESNAESRCDCLPVHKNRTPFQQQDVLVPWHKKNIAAKHSEILPQKTESTENLKNDLTRDRSTFHRYYHVFKKGELTELCETFDNAKVVESYYDEGNWCAILQKL